MSNKTLLSILGFSLLSYGVANAEEITLKQKVKVIIENINTETSLPDSANFTYNGKEVAICFEKAQEVSGFYLKFPNLLENDVHFVIADLSENGYGSVDLVGIVKGVDINAMYKHNLKIPTGKQLEKANQLYVNVVNTYYSYVIDSKKLEEKKIDKALKKLLEE